MEEKHTEAIQELKYRLVLIKSCDDDPLTQIELIRILKETYKKHDIEISEKVNSYLKDKIKEIEEKLKVLYEEKKKAYEDMKTNHEKKEIEHKRIEHFGEKLKNI